MLTFNYAMLLLARLAWLAEPVLRVQAPLLIPVVRSKLQEYVEAIRAICNAVVLFLPAMSAVLGWCAYPRFCGCLRLRFLLRLLDLLLSMMALLHQ